MKIASWLAEKQARDILVLDVQGRNAITESLVIVSATSLRHAQALADWIMEKFSAEGLELLGIEGYHPGNWVLVDANDVLVHIFLQEYRVFYNLEGLWSEAPRLPVPSYV